MVPGTGEIIMNNNYIVLNDTVKLFYEDGFHVMDDSELAKLRSPWQGPMQGLSDPARHIMITIGWKPVGNVLSMLLKPKDIAKKMESDIRKAMKAYDYRPQGFLTKEIAGQKAEGFAYEYEAEATSMYGESIVLKHGKEAYYFHYYSSALLRWENQKFWDRIFETAEIIR